MRRRDQSNPQDERELEALDRALAGEPVDADLGELERIVLDVRATAPQMSPAFAARLEQGVADGFPSPAAARAQPRRRRRWVLIPAAGTIAAGLVAVVVVLGQAGEDRQAATSVAEAPTAPSVVDSATEPGAAAPAPPASAADEAAGSAGNAGGQLNSAPPEAKLSARQRSAAPLSAQPSPSSGAIVPADRGKRQVERTALLVLQTPDGRFQATTDAVIRTVDRFDGIVANSSIGASEENGGEATFNLRIPTGKLDEALAALSRLGHVAERSQDLQDITGSFTSAQERLSEARAERRGLLRALGNAATQPRIVSLRARLRVVRSTISRLKGDLASLRRRADLSSVTVTVRAGGDSGGTVRGDHWTPGDAARDAVRVLEVIAGVALIALAVAVPLALLGAVIAFGAHIGRRRGRERALDPA